MRATTNTQRSTARIAGTSGRPPAPQTRRFDPKRWRPVDQQARLHLPSLDGNVVDQVLVYLDSLEHVPTGGAHHLQITTGSVDELSLAT
jgi:hypothetical protein